jgi:hypothetical protein
MSGEVIGTDIILANGTGAIVGQMEGTLTFNGSPIDISNKSYSDNITLLDNELAGKQLQFAGSIVYNDDTQFRKVRGDSLIGKQDDYTIIYVSAATTDESFSAKMTPNGLSDALPHGDKVSTTITFLSSGVITHVDAVT